MRVNRILSFLSFCDVCSDMSIKLLGAMHDGPL